VAGQKPGSQAFPNKGARIGQRNEKGELVPYYDRSAIEAGALDGRKLEICWLRDPADLVTIQIEGSARIILEDGTPLRINYDSHNGYSYTSLSSALIQSHRIARREMSPQHIREWMTAHPEEAQKVRAANRSYMFFRITGLSNEGEAVGAQGVPLTPGRSIAVDRLHDYGTPFFIEAKLPVENAQPALPFHRLMIAQDTGSAIVGPARADLYWGAGDDAGRIAGRTHHPGRFVMLMPRELDMIAAGRHMPLPLPKPKLAELEVRKQNGQGSADVRRQNGQGSAEVRRQNGQGSAEVRKQNGQGSAEVRKQNGQGSAEVRKQQGSAEVKKQNSKGSADPVKPAVDPRAAAAYARWRSWPLH
jgi:membrane-bound lytic murein transglycosylase A